MKQIKNAYGANRPEKANTGREQKEIKAKKTVMKRDLYRTSWPYQKQMKSRAGLVCTVSTDGKRRRRKND